MELLDPPPQCVHVFRSGTRVPPVHVKVARKHDGFSEPRHTSTFDGYQHWVDVEKSLEKVAVEEAYSDVVEEYVSLPLVSIKPWVWVRRLEHGVVVVAPCLRR